MLIAITMAALRAYQPTSTSTVGEVVATVLVLVGWYARSAAIVIAINMVFAIYLAHRADLFKLAATGGYALELQALYLIVAIAIALLGPGRYSIDER